MTQIENRTTSLAQQLENAGFTRTSIATAVAELVGSWLGAQHIDGKLLKQLQTTNTAVAVQLTDSTSGKEGKKDTVSNDDQIQKVA